MLNSPTEYESGNAVREGLEALLTTSKAELDALKPLADRLKGAEQRVNNKAKQLEKATAHGIDLAEQLGEHSDTVKKSTEELLVLGTAWEVDKPEEAMETQKYN